MTPFPYVPEVALFLNGTNFLSSTANGCVLVAATLASTGGTSTGAVHFQEFGLGVEFLDAHLEGMDGGAAKTAEAVGVLDTVGHLRLSNKVSVVEERAINH